MASFNACSSHGWRDLSAGASAVSILSMHATKRHHPFWAISGSGKPSGALSQLARARGRYWWRRASTSPPGRHRPGGGSWSDRSQQHPRGTFLREGCCSTTPPTSAGTVALRLSWTTSER